MKTPARQARLIGLTLLACLAFSPPLLIIFDRPSNQGISWLPVYLFASWLLLLALAAWLLEKPAKNAEDQDDE